MNQEQDLTRRSVLKSGAGGAIGGVFLSQTLAAADLEQRMPNLYNALGVKPIINAAGTITTLGGSLMPPEVIAAWTEALKELC